MAVAVVSECASLAPSPCRSERNGADGWGEGDVAEGKIKIPKRPDTDGLGIAPTPIPVGIQPFRLLGDLFA